MLQQVQICSFQSGCNMSFHFVSFDCLDSCLCFHQLNPLSVSVAIFSMMAWCINAITSLVFNVDLILSAPPCSLLLLHSVVDPTEVSTSGPTGCGCIGSNRVARSSSSRRFQTDQNAMFHWHLFQESTSEAYATTEVQLFDSEKIPTRIFGNWDRRRKETN